MFTTIGCWPVFWERLAGAWQSMQLRSGKKVRAQEPEEDMTAVVKEVPPMVLHPRDARFGDLATADEYPHRFNIRPDGQYDQVQWFDEDEEGKKTLHAPVPYRLCSEHSRDICFMRLRNTTPHRVRMLWLDYMGNEVAYEIIEPHETILQQTYFTHPWLVREITTCSQLLLNGQEAVMPSEQLHQQQLQQLQQRQNGGAQQQGQQQQGQPHAPQLQLQQPGQAGGAAAAAQGQQQAGAQQQQQQQQQLPIITVAGLPVLDVEINGLPQLVWTKETHASFPAWFKASSKAFLLCHQKLAQRLVLGASSDQEDSSNLAHLPAVLLPHIVSMAAPVVPQGVHFPPAARKDIKPVMLPEPPTAAAGAGAEQ